MQNEATKANKADDRAYLDEPTQPLLQGNVPKLSDSRHVNEVRFFPPVFPINGTPKQTQILAVAIAPTPEEASSVLVTQHNEHYQKPRLLKGPLGQILKDVIDRFSELQSDRMTYATAIPWLLPKARRFRPNKDELEWTKPYLLELVKYTKPTVILAFGKLVFDQLVDLKISADDARGGWFDSDGIPVYLMDPAHQMVTQPWTLDNVITDFKEVARMVSIRCGTNIPEEPVRSEEIRTMEQLEDLVSRWEAGNFILQSTDGEWKGPNYIDGQLRSMQFAWTDFDGAYLNFFNEHGEPILGRTQNLTGEKLWNINQWIEPEAFYVDYAAVGRVLGRWLNRPEVKFIGHYCCADSVWLEHWLGIKVIAKFIFDSAFAMQTISEYSPQGLERLALQVTNFGRYDMPLVRWKKENPKLMQADKGYGAIPDKILIPYACLAWDSQVQLGDGSWELIHKLVQSRYTGTVMALVDGEVRPCAVTNWKKTRNPGQAWFRVVTPTTAGAGKDRGFRGPRFTPDHKILTNTGFVRVDRLVPGTHKVATAQMRMSADQRQIILGSLLGDGGIHSRNGVGCRMLFSQSGVNIPYAEWKAEALRGVLSFHEDYRTYEDNRAPSASFTSRYNPEVAAIAAEFERSEGGIRRGHFKIEERLLEEAGDLGLAVWVMDDGTRVQNTLRLSRQSSTEEEAQAGLKYFQRRFGRGVVWRRSNGVFIFSHGAFWRLMDVVKPYFHPCMRRKHVEGDDITAPPVVDKTCPGVFFETILKVVTADRPRGNKKMECFRYCLTVPEAGNFLTKLGFVSNCLDAIVPFRAKPILEAELKRQGTLVYFQDIVMPLVSDTFHQFRMTGLPVNRELFDATRGFMNWAYKELLKDFLDGMADQADQLMANATGVPWQVLKQLREMGATGARNWLATQLPVIEAPRHNLMAPSLDLTPEAMRPEFTKELLDHWENVATFNIQSSDQKARWLFHVMNLMPVKSTGKPSMMWEKVQTLPLTAQKNMKPAADKETIEILAEIDTSGLLPKLLNLSNVGNICKGFLKEGSLDQDGEVVKENGLAQFIASDGSIHCLWPLTETSRPRTFLPNVLNLSKFLNKYIFRGLMILLDKVEIPQEFEILFGSAEDREGMSLKDLIKERVPSVRSVIKAPAGWCLTESDYRTAEVRQSFPQIRDERVPPSHGFRFEWLMKSI